MRFYEQINEGRTVISAEVIPEVRYADRVTDSVDADCWIDAKQKLGYMLSATQDWLLAEFYRKQGSRSAQASG
jgi:hypothetical protein